MGKINLIIKREYTSRVKKKSFIVMTLLGPLIFTGLIAGVMWLAFESSEYHEILIADETGTYPQLSEFKHPEVSVTYTTKSYAEAKEELRESETYTAVLGYAVSPQAQNNSGLTWLMHYKKLPNNRIQNGLEHAIEKIWRRDRLLLAIQEDSLDVADIKLRDIESAFTTDVSLNMNKLGDDESKDKEFNQEVAVVGLAFAVIIYIAVILFGVQVMRGVIEEKTNRIVEVIISSVKPFQLMMGKIIGIGLVGLTQFALWIILTLILVTVATSTLLPSYDAAQVMEQVSQSPIGVQQGLIEDNKAMLAEAQKIQESLIFQIPWIKLLFTFLFYFFGGYMLYSALFAAVGSAVDSETDTQQFMFPVTIPLILAYIVAIMMMDNPESPAVWWFSMIPFTSPVVMMARAPLDPPIWELLLSMSLLVITFIFFTWIAGRIYRTGILMYGKKASIRELFKWVRYRG